MQLLSRGHWPGMERCKSCSSHLPFPLKPGESEEWRGGGLRTAKGGCGRTGCGNCIPLRAGTCLFQDTVVALQALSLYGAVTYAKSGAASKVTLRSGGDFQQDFRVDATNRLLLQRVPLPQVPGEYSTEVSGEGCVYLQVRLMGAGGTLGGETLARQEPGRGSSGRERGKALGEGKGEEDRRGVWR